MSNSIFSGFTISNLVNDLLDLAKMENQSFSLANEYTNLFEVAT